MLAAISWPAPPPGYGPWEQIAFNVADGMRRRGLDVTLFATGNSRFDGKLASVVPVGLNEDPALNGDVFTALHIAELFRRARRVRSDQQPLRLEAADVRAGLRSGRRWSRRSTASRRRKFWQPIMPGPRAASTVRSRMPIAIPASTISRRPTTASIRRSSRSANAPASISAFSAAFIPKKERISRSRSPSAPAFV